MNKHFPDRITNLELSMSDFSSLPKLVTVCLAAGMLWAGLQSVTPSATLAQPTVFTTIHNFNGKDGAEPRAGLLQASDGSLYGTTGSGSGKLGAGTLFRFSPGTARLTILHVFGNTSGDGMDPFLADLIQATDGTIYGTTEFGGLFRVGPDGPIYSGTVYQFVPNGSYSITHQLMVTDTQGFNTDGANPIAGLTMAHDGNLYGTAAFGGTHGCGSIFKISVSSNIFSTVYSFGCGADGASPEAALLEASDGNLYGTTQGGGEHQMGTLFRLPVGSSDLVTIHAFNGADGAGPLAKLVQAGDSNLYGTALFGGAADKGTIFRLIPASGSLQLVHSFKGGREGANPTAGLVEASDGNLYGTTEAGGSRNMGTLFRLPVGSSKLSTIHTFTGQDGSTPQGGLIQASDGNLYGTTFVGGTNNFGTLFQIRP